MDKDYTLHDVYKVAGEKITKLIITLTDKNKVSEVPNWFYTPNKGLNGKSPFEICKENPVRLETKLMDILTAAQGG